MPTDQRFGEIRISAADGRVLVIKGAAYPGLGVQSVTLGVGPTVRWAPATSHVQAYSADEPVETMLLRLIHQCQMLRAQLRAEV